MIKDIKDLSEFELEQFKILYIKYLVEDAKRTMLGIPLLYELLTKKHSKKQADVTVNDINDNVLVGYVYIYNGQVIGFIIGEENKHKDAIILAALTTNYSNRIILLELYKTLALEFKRRSKKFVYINTSLYDDLLMYIANECSFNVLYEYPDGYVEYAKQL